MKTWQCTLISAAVHGLIFSIQPATPEIPNQQNSNVIKLLVMEKQNMIYPAQNTEQSLKPSEPVEVIRSKEIESTKKKIEEKIASIKKVQSSKPEYPNKKQAAPKKKIQQVVKKEKVKQPEKKKNPVKPPEKIVQPVVKQKVPAPATENIQAAVSPNKENLPTANNKRISNTRGTEIKADKIANLPAPVVKEFGALGGPKFARRVMPKYPKAAQRLGVEGDVTLKLAIDASGKLTKVEVVKGAGHGFDEEAVRAVKHSKFSPAFQNGNPVGCVALIKIQFKLNSDV